MYFPVAMFIKNKNLATFKAASGHDDSSVRIQYLSSLEIIFVTIT